MTKFISEIGINHNGSLELCKELIMLSKAAGADYVKIQKRNPDVFLKNKRVNVGTRHGRNELFRI